VSPALSDLPYRRVVRALESVGFSYERTKGSHAVYRSQDGRVVVVRSTAS
jgi:predicted RNA binding protein YcfA (HicA-like mRNA interferase family)